MGKKKPDDLIQSDSKEIETDLMQFTAIELHADSHSLFKGIIWFDRFYPGCWKPEGGNGKGSGISLVGHRATMERGPVRVQQETLWKARGCRKA